jgi:hypothetical protein
MERLKRDRCIDENKDDAPKQKKKGIKAELARFFLMASTTAALLVPATASCTLLLTPKAVGVRDAGRDADVEAEADGDIRDADAPDTTTGDADRDAEIDARPDAEVTDADFDGEAADAEFDAEPDADGDTSLCPDVYEDSYEGLIYIDVDPFREIGNYWTEFLGENDTTGGPEFRITCVEGGALVEDRAVFVEDGESTYDVIRDRMRFRVNSRGTTDHVTDVTIIVELM